MNILKKTMIIISLLTSTTGFAFADGHEAPGSGYWSTVSQETHEFEIAIRFKLINN